MLTDLVVLEVLDPGADEEGGPDHHVSPLLEMQT